MTRLLVLGGSGYIGSNLLESLPPNFEAIQIHRSNFDYKIIQNTKFDIIINLSASKITANKQDSLESNYNFQSGVIESLSSKNFKWIQIASYYELQIEYGRVDYYSLHKTKFRDFLKNWSSRHTGFEYSCLFLPHIFGKNESSSRLIPSIQKLNRGEKTFFGSRNQQIPLMHIQDAVNSIILATNSNEQNCSAPPMWYGKLNTLIKDSVKNIDVLKLAEYDNEIDNYSIQKVKFPEPLFSFKHLLNYNQFSDCLKKGLAL
jgi:nucleoside-diphosphate-sugar epimerase